MINNQEIKYSYIYNINFEQPAELASLGRYRFSEISLHRNIKIPTHPPLLRVINNGNLPRSSDISIANNRYHIRAKLIYICRAEKKIRMKIKFAARSPPWGQILDEILACGRKRMDGISGPNNQGFATCTVAGLSLQPVPRSGR